MSLLKALRIDMGLSQYELSSVSHVPKYVIQLAEIGNRLPTVYHAEKLAQALSTELLYVFPEIVNGLEDE